MGNTGSATITPNNAAKDTKVSPGDVDPNDIETNIKDPYDNLEYYVETSLRDNPENTYYGYTWYGSPTQIIQLGKYTGSREGVGQYGTLTNNNVDVDVFEKNVYDRTKKDSQLYKYIGPTMKGGKRKKTKGGNRKKKRKSKRRVKKGGAAILL